MREEFVVMTKALESQATLLAKIAQMIQLREMDSDDNYTRTSILIACAMKVERQVRAMLVLQEADCLEEVAIVARTMIELVTNGIYLQHAEDDELGSFLSFDAQKISARLLAEHAAAGLISEAAEAQASLSKYRLKTGQSDNALTWSKRTLAKRAVFADIREPVAALCKLHDLSSRLCNFAIHATFLSLIGFLPDQETRGGFPQRDNFSKLSISLASMSIAALSQHITARLSRDQARKS